MNGCFEKNLEKLIDALGAVQIANQIIEVDAQATKTTTILRSFLRKRIILGLNSA